MNKPRIVQVNIIVYYILLFVYFVMEPFYFYESGLPKISDFILMLLFIFLLISNNLKIYKTHQMFIFLGVVFVGYIFLVNSIWIVIHPNSDFIFSTTYYIYNLLACLIIVCLYQIFGEKLFKLILISLIFSVGIQFLLGIILYTGSSRETIFFNNPNQLGGYAIASLAILLVLSEKININKFLFITIIIMCFILAAFSLSKAALFSLIIILPLYFIFSRTNYKIRNIPANILLFSLIIISFIVVIPNDSELFKDIPLVTNVQERISSTGEQSDDNLLGRGYDRIINSPQYIVFGAGEGENDRFKSVLSGKEIHSTIGNILFSYGIIGFTLFITWVLYVIYQQRMAQIIPIIVLFIYGLSHNGIRDTLLWILITIVFVDKYRIPKFYREDRNIDT